MLLITLIHSDSTIFATLVSPGVYFLHLDKVVNPDSLIQ